MLASREAQRQAPRAHCHADIHLIHAAIIGLCLHLQADAERKGFSFDARKCAKDDIHMDALNYHYSLLPTRRMPLASRQPD